MKKFLAYAFLFSIVAVQFVSAEDGFEALKKDPGKAAGVMWPYEFDVPKHAPAPKGFKPFYISHYGRHGARFATKSVRFEKLKTLLENAQSEGKLTAKGQRLASRYLPIAAQFRLRGGDLTSKGQKEHFKLAQRMYKNYRQVFKRGARIEARSTDVPRVILSMAAFIDGLHACRKDLQIVSWASNADMHFTNPFSLFNTDVQPTDEGFYNDAADWRKELDAYGKKILHHEDFVKSFFTDMAFVKKYDTANEVASCIWDVAKSAQAMENIPSFWDFFDYEELCSGWEYNNYLYFLSKGPDETYGGRQWAFVWTTMQDILDRAEEDMKSGLSANLRFGHDITIISLMALLDIEGWNKSPKQPEDLKNMWQQYNVPFASNMQFIFYRNKKGEVLVRLMQNERDQILPIQSDMAPYYKWNDFKVFCQKRIAVARQIIKTTKAPKPLKHQSASSLNKLG